MAPTISARKDRESWTAGNKRITVTTATLDNYVTGGYAFTNAQLGHGSKATIIFVETQNVNGYALDWDYTNGKLKAFSAPGTELANASAALNAAVVRLYAVATG